MNNNKNVQNIAGTDYFVLTADNVFAFADEVTTWAGDAVNHVTVHNKFPGSPRKVTVVTETGRRFVVVADNYQIPMVNFS